MDADSTICAVASICRQRQIRRLVTTIWRWAIVSNYKHIELIVLEACTDRETAVKYRVVRQQRSRQIMQTLSHGHPAPSPGSWYSAVFQADGEVNKAC